VRALAAQFYSQPTSLGFDWVEYYGQVSRLAVVVQIRRDSEHACLPREWAAVMATRSPQAGTAGMDLSLTSVVAYRFTLVLGRIVGR
jgi:hypothetical protein